jgi:hypothetical protein
MSFATKNRTIDYRKALGLHVDLRQVSKKYQELQVAHCISGAQVKGVEGMVLTHIDKQPIFDIGGSLSFEVMLANLKNAKKKKKNFQITFHDKNWIRHDNKLTADKKKKQAELLKKKKEKKEKQRKKLADEKAAKKLAKQAAAREKFRNFSLAAAAKKKKISASKKGTPLKKVPRKVFIVDPKVTPEVGLQIEEKSKKKTNYVTVMKCHKGTPCKGTKGYILFKIDNFQCYNSMKVVQKLLKKLMYAKNKSQFSLTFVKEEHVEAMIKYEKQVIPTPFSSSSSSSSSSTTGKRKATSSLENEVKKLKSTNSNLRKQVKVLQKNNAELSKLNNQLISKSK